MRGHNSYQSLSSRDDREKYQESLIVEPRGYSESTSSRFSLYRVLATVAMVALAIIGGVLVSFKSSMTTSMRTADHVTDFSVTKTKNMVTTTSVEATAEDSAVYVPSPTPKPSISPTISPTYMQLSFQQKTSTSVPTGFDVMAANSADLKTWVGYIDSKLWVSLDTGISWKSIVTLRNSDKISCLYVSQKGMNITAISDDGDVYIYTISSYGGSGVLQTRTIREMDNCNAIAGSVTADYQVAITDNGDIYATKDGAQSWSKLPEGKFDNDIKYVACSSTCQYIAIAGEKNDYVYYSTDYGETFTAAGKERMSIYALAISWRGDTITAIATTDDMNGNSANGVVMTRDYGVTWTVAPGTYIKNNLWNALACDPGHCKIAVGSKSSPYPMMASPDSGMNWNYQSDSTFPSVTSQNKYKYLTWDYMRFADDGYSLLARASSDGNNRMWYAKTNARSLCVMPTAFPTSPPTWTPTSRPTTAPTFVPSRQPTFTPSFAPSAVPSNAPSAQPTFAPSFAPSAQPTEHPTEWPSLQPTHAPSAEFLLSKPTGEPTYKPTHRPTSEPSYDPTADPSTSPTFEPSRATQRPTTDPTLEPTHTSRPTAAPTEATAEPSDAPTQMPSLLPSAHPTDEPSAVPTDLPTLLPTKNPTETPTAKPSDHPSDRPSHSPTFLPSDSPTNEPTNLPSQSPTHEPTYAPTSEPSAVPTHRPSNRPSEAPTDEPTHVPSFTPTTTMRPSGDPTFEPTHAPSSVPTDSPTDRPSFAPTHEPSQHPTRQPTYQPTEQPTLMPTSEPSNSPTDLPTHMPTKSPTEVPTAKPTEPPSARPTHAPSDTPTQEPTAQPTDEPTAVPSATPSDSPTLPPTSSPSHHPTDFPTFTPSYKPTSEPSAEPTHMPTDKPTHKPSASPSHHPSNEPTQEPTFTPTDTMKPSGDPSFEPTHTPSFEPTHSPTGAHPLLPLSPTKNNKKKHFSPSLPSRALTSIPPKNLSTPQTSLRLCLPRNRQICRRSCHRFCPLTCQHTTLPIIQPSPPRILPPPCRLTSQRRNRLSHPPTNQAPGLPTR